MISFQNILKVAHANLKIAFQNNILLSALLLILTPLIFSIKNLDFLMAARLCEQFIALIGVLILVPIFDPEADPNIKETVEAKATSMLFVYIIRIIMSIIILISIISIAVNILIYFGGNFTSGRLILGTFASALFLGGLGLIITSITENVVVGYMVSIFYFSIDIMTNGKYTKNLSVFSLMKNSFKEKYYLLVAAIVLIILSLLVYWIKNSKR